MSRKLRFTPVGSLVEITCRTIQGRNLLRPTPECVDRILGVVGRAQRMYPLVIHAMIVLGNHVHILASPESAQQLSRFMRYFSSNVARKVGPLARWLGKFWEKRYTSIVVSDEERAQVARLKYLLSNGCKEGLVLSPREWPGVSSTNVLLDGTMRLYGSWLNFTKRRAERAKGREPVREAFATPEVVVFSKLPCWEHLSDQEYRERILELVEVVEDETEQQHKAQHTEAMGIDAVLARDAHATPVDFQPTPAPAFHTATHQKFLELREAYCTFAAAFEVAANRLRQGFRDVQFPIGSFPPALPIEVYSSA